MSILFRRRSDGDDELRAITSLPFNRLGGIGVGKSMEASLRLAPIYSAISLISDALITLPFHAYTDQGVAGKKKVVQQPKLVSDPSPFVDALTWRSQYVASMLLRGNAYGFNLGLDAMARPQQISWLNPDVVTMDETRDRPTYLVAGQPAPEGSITHVRAFTLPGAKAGLSPLSLFRTQIEAGIGADKFSSAWFANGAAPSSILRQTKKSMTQDEADIAKRRYKATVKAGDMLVIGSDWEYEKLTVGAADAKFVEQAKLTANQIAAIYHVPADEIGGETGGSLTYSTLELNDMKLTRRGVLPWSVRLEHAVNTHLAPPQYSRFNLDAYVRADLKTRMEAHRIGLQIGLETQDEGRALEDRPPLTEAEQKYWADNYRRMSISDSGSKDPGGDT